MVRTTRKQREALKRLYDRAPIYADGWRQITYREFRKGVQPTIGCDGAIIIRWSLMWIAIERDGYTHS